MKEPSMQGRTVLAELTRAEWKDLLKRLKLYTYKNFGTKVNGRFDLLDEVIQEAIEDTYYGNRRLPPEVDLTVFLCGTIRSKIGHLLEKEKRNISIEEVEGTSQQIHLTKLFGASKQNPHLAERGEESYQGVMYKELCGQIREAAQSNTLLLQLVELLFVTPDLKPGEIALQMNQPVEKVHNLLRRLRRRIGKSK